MEGEDSVTGVPEAPAAHAHRRRAGRRPLARRLGAVPLACVIGVLMVLAFASAVWNSSGSYGRGAGVHNGSIGAGTVPENVDYTHRAATPVATDQSLAPTRIDLPTLHSSAPIVDVGTLPNNELQIPLNPRIVGWWSPGAHPGAAKGTAIIAGHINYAGVQGALGQIGKLKPGDRFTIYGKAVNSGGAAQLTFQVTGVRTYPKSSLPWAQIFDQNSVGRVALVTCGGPFDNATGNYLDNIVAYAVLVTS